MLILTGQGIYSYDINKTEIPINVSKESLWSGKEIQRPSQWIQCLLWLRMSILTEILKYHYENRGACIPNNAQYTCSRTNVYLFCYKHMAIIAMLFAPSVMMKLCSRHQHYIL